MHMIKEKLMEELYEVEKKLKNAGGGKISAGDLEYIHKLTDTIKNIDKIEMLEDGGYSEATDFMGEGRMYGMSYEGGSSGARGRRGGRRDSMGRYSRAEGKERMAEKLREMMQEAEGQEREAIRKCLKEIENA